MSGQWFWNFSFALFGFLLYFFLSIEKKEPMNLLIESFLVFILFYFLMYFVRFLWVVATMDPNQQLEQNQPQEPNQPQVHKKPLQQEENQLVRRREEELVQLTKQLEEEDVDKVLAYIRSQFQQDRQ